MTISETAYPPQCAACGGYQFLRSSIWHEPLFICGPCFMIWYDPPGGAIDVTDPKQVGARSLELKAAGKYPWTGEYAP